MDVEFQEVRVHRDGRLVLEIPSLRLRSGQTTAVLGPNGAGKTTLLRVIAGLEAGRMGRVAFGGAPPPPVAFVFQEEVFLRHSVRANLELGLKLRGVHRAERQARIEGAARLLGIEGLLDRRADHLSGGEGRRVSLARALSLRAPVVLLDEPLAGLDERTYSHLIDELPALLSAFDATTVLVTHNPGEALRLAEDLVVLVDGQVRAAGSKRHVATQPGDADVAKALGHSILTVNGRLIAVPPGALALGPGEVECSLVVDEVLDLVYGRRIVGRVDGVRVSVALPDGMATPARGDRVRVHADRCSHLAR